MKSFKTKSIQSFSLILLALLFSGVQLMAQPGMGRGQNRNWDNNYNAYNNNYNYNNGICNRIPDLSPDQQTKITELRTAHLQEMTPLRNEMQVMRAELRALNSGDAVNLDQVNSKIDELAILKSKMMKKGAAHRQEVRQLLSPAQQAVFDTRGPRYQRNGKGFRQGRQGRQGRYQGNCPNWW